MIQDPQSSKKDEEEFDPYEGYYDEFEEDDEYDYRGRRKEKPPPRKGW